MRKTLVTILCSALIVASSIQTAAAAEHDQTRKASRGEDAYRCPAGEKLTYHYTNEENGQQLRRYWKKHILEAELIERRLDVIGNLLIEARMADENGWHLLLPDRSTSIQVTSNSSHYTTWSCLRQYVQASLTHVGYCAGFRTPA